MHLIPNLMELAQLDEKEEQISKKNRIIDLMVNEKITIYIPKDGSYKK